MYDPALGRFLSADPYVQLPDFSQNFNRYSYALNNPLLYTDPSGEFPLLFAIGALIGGYIGGSMANKDWSPWNGGWDWSDPGTYFGIGFGALAGGLGLQAALGPGGWFASGQGINLNIGLNMGEWATAVGQFGIESGAVTWQGLEYVTAAAGGAWVTKDFLKGNEPEGPYIDTSWLNYERNRRSGSSYFGAFIDRKSGSIYFEDRTAAYDYMWMNSFSNGKPIREVSGWELQNGGTIVMPYHENTLRMSKNKWQPVEKNHVKFNSTWYPIYTHVHTHPSFYLFGNPGLSTGALSDEHMFYRLSVPLHVIYNGHIFEADYYQKNWRILRIWKW